MKKGRPVDNSKNHNLSQDSEDEYRLQYSKDFQDTYSCIVINDKLQTYLQTKKSLLNRCNDNDSDSDCSQKAQYNGKSKEVCGYCQKDKHNVNNCPLFANAIQEQSNMLCTYNALSSDYSNQLDHFTSQDKTDQQHTKVCQKDQNEYLRKYYNNDIEVCHQYDQRHLVLVRKAQEEYYNKRCNYCKEYGHLEDKCQVLEKAVDRQPQNNWRGKETKKSKRSKKNKVSITEVHNLPEIHVSASDCAKETKDNYFSKYCHYCKEYGHIENICPLVQKVLKKQKGKNVTVMPKIHKKDHFSSPVTKVNKDFRKLETMCNFCGNSKHKEDDCTEKNQYIKNHTQNCKQQVQLKDMCPSLEEDVRKLENQNYKFFPNGQTVSGNLNNKTKFKHAIKLQCKFCGDSDHSESECEEKLQHEYISKYCHYCEEYGHFEDTCPLVEEAASENQSICKVSPTSLKKVTFANDITTLSENLADLKICPICDEFGHNEDDCFVKQQAEFYSKYCDRCKENGHVEKDCVINKKSSNNSLFSNIFLKKDLEFKTRAELYVNICSDHYLCENCHNIYYDEPKSTESEKCAPKNTRKTAFQSSFEANACRLRYCTLCGIEGLIDICILKKRAANE